MGTGYTRNDTADNIADGNIINASDLDGEFDALQSAFDNSTGHTHDGTAGEGAPVEKVGPNQEVVVTATVLRPAANNTIDLGVETTNEFKNLYIDGTAYLDSVDIDGGTIDGLSVLTVDNLSLNGNTITSTDTNGNLNLRANGTGIISVDATDINFGDNDKATFGDGSDLSITHNGTNSIITDSGTGNLLLRGSNVSIQNAAGNETVAQFVEDSFVKLYHDNSEVFSTTSTGISVTGDVDASDDLILSSDSSKITFGADGDVELEHIHNFGLTLKTTGTGDNAFPEFVLQSNEDTIIADEVIGRIDFDTNSTAGGVSVGVQARITVDATDTYSSTVAGSRLEFYTTESGGALNKAMVIDPDQSIRFTGGTDVKLDATNDTLDFPDNFKIMMGAGDDLQIYHDGSHSYVDENGTGQLKIRSNGTGVLLQTVSGENLATFANNAAVNLYYDNSAKLATTSTGVDITGGFTATDGSTITVNDNSVALNLVSTDTDATQGPVFRLTRDAVGAASDTIGTIQFYGEDAGGNATEYVELQAQIDDATDGSEDGKFEIRAFRAGTAKTIMLANATETVFNDGSIDLDFRVESNGNANMLFVDGGNNRVGVGTNVPDYPLVVQAANSRLQLLNTGANTGISGLLFGDADTATRGQINYNHSSDSLDIVVNASEAMRILSSGSVGIGTNLPTGLLDLSATTGSGTLNIISTVNAVNAGNKIAFFGASRSDADEEMAYIKPLLVSNSGGSGNVQEGHLTFGTSGVERMRLNATGKLSLGTDLTNADDSLLHITSGSTTNFSMLQLENTSADAATAPDIVFYRNSASPADDDNAGALHFYANNSAAERTLYGMIYNQLRDVTDGTEDSKFVINVMKDGSLREVLTAASHEVVVNEESRDVDFRVESTNDANAFFVNGADGNVGMSVSDPASHIPVSHNAGKRSFVNFFGDGTQFVAGRSDTTVGIGNYIGGYLFKTNDVSGNKFGGMISTADDVSGNGNLEFYAVSNAYESALEGHMQIDDSGDLYLRGGGIKVGRSHGNVYTSTEEVIAIFHAGSGSNDTSTAITSRDGTGADPVFRHQRRGTIKSEIEEDGSFHSAVSSYGGTSDQRLKENIVASGSQWDDIKALQVKKYSMIEDELDAPNMIGVIAQDLQASGMNGLVQQHFKTDTDDNPVLDADGNQEEYLSVKYSVLYMKAIKALQEAMAKIEVLETKVAALEAE